MKIAKLLEEATPISCSEPLSSTTSDHLKACGIIHPQNDNIKAVGLYFYEDTLYLFYPKYFKGFKSDASNVGLKQILQVMRKLTKAEHDFELLDEGSQKTALALELIEDYFAHGLYVPVKKSLGVNTSDEYLWEKSLQEAPCYISDGRPYYLELFSVSEDTQANAFITALHRAIIANILDKYEGLLELFSYPRPFIDSALSLDDLLDAARHYLPQARRADYSLRGARTLGLMKRYLDDAGDGLSLKEGYGFYTTSFKVVWERALKIALHDDLDRKICDLGLIGEPDTSINTSKTLKEHIPTHEYESANRKKKDGNGALTPDIIVAKDGNFIIYDAKYYQEECLPEGASVNKQFLYLKAYEGLLLANMKNIKDIGNAFLLPRTVQSVDKGADEGVEGAGKDKLKGLFSESLKGFAPVHKAKATFHELFSFKAPLPSHIKVITLDAAAVFRAYLKH